METALFEKIFLQHREYLGDFDFVNPVKLVILFSGIPGSGKSTIAKKLQERYHALRLNNDMVRDLFRDELGINELEILQVYLTEYSELLLRKAMTLSNKTVILDSSIDRKYKRISEAFQQQGYSMFLIRIVLPLETIKERLIKREKDPTNYFNKLEQWTTENEKFNDEVTPDFTITTGTEEEMQALFTELDSRLQYQH